MSLDRAAVRHIALLARIRISDAEADALVGDLSKILAWVEQLGEVAAEAEDVPEAEARSRSSARNSPSCTTRASRTRSSGPRLLSWAIGVD